MRNILLGFLLVISISLYSSTASAVSVNVQGVEDLSWGETIESASQKYSLNSLLSLQEYNLPKTYQLYGEQMYGIADLFFFKDKLLTVFLPFEKPLSGNRYDELKMTLTKEFGESVGDVNNNDRDITVWIKNDVVISLDKNGISYTSFSLARKMMVGNEIDFKEWQQFINAKIAPSKVNTLNTADMPDEIILDDGKQN